MALDYEQMTDEELCDLAEELRAGDAEEDEEPDFEEAAVVIQVAADRGYARALCDLGVYYMNGEGVKKDEKKAVECWQKAAVQGYAPALYKLGVCSLQGSCGQEKNEAKAAEYFVKAADAGDVDSMLNLSILYSNGIGVKRDPVKAMAYLNQAVESGQPSACCFLGATLTANPNASEEDVERGAKLLEQAAEAGHVEGQFLYGLCCQRGRGVEKDLAEAAGWFRRAAKAGMPQANEALMQLGFPGVM